MGPRKLEVTAVPDAREPGPAEALVRVTAVGVCGTDLHFYRGAHSMVDLGSFVSHRVPLEGGPRAFQALADYHKDATKVVIVPA